MTITCTTTILVEAVVYTNIGIIIIDPISTLVITVTAKVTRITAITSTVIIIIIINATRIYIVTIIIVTVHTKQCGRFPNRS